MVRFQDHRISKPVPSRFRSRNMSNPVRTTNINTKGSIFAHTHFSPTEPSRSVDDLMEVSIHTERRDSPALMVASLNSAADDWDCKDCSWKLRMLAGKFNLKFHAKRSEGPTSSPAAYETLDLGSLAIDSPPTPPSSDSSRSSSPLPDEIVGLRRQTLTNDAGEGEPFYGVHQAHLDLSLGESVTVHMRPTDLKRNRYELKPGTIISAPFHSQYRDSTVSTSNYNTAVSGFGAVYSKYRKMVIIETWADHVVCLPMYSYNGRGLENRQGMLDEYIDIRDADEEYHEPGDTPLEPLLATRGKEWAGKNTFISGRTVIKLTEKTTHSMFQKCSIEGKIESEHFRRLYRLYYDLVQRKVLEFFGKPIDSMVIIPN